MILLRRAHSSANSTSSTSATNPKSIKVRWTVVTGMCATSVTSLGSISSTRWTTKFLCSQIANRCDLDQAEVESIELPKRTCGAEGDPRPSRSPKCQSLQALVPRLRHSDVAEHVWELSYPQADGHPAIDGVVTHTERTRLISCDQAVLAHDKPRDRDAFFPWRRLFHIGWDRIPHWPALW